MTLEARIQAYLRKAASHGRETEPVGPFLCTFTPTNDMVYINYAIPEDGSEPSPTEIAELIAAYQRRERTPRLEYIPLLAPAVEPALLAAGFMVENRTPLMVCPRGSEVVIPPPAGIELVRTQTHGERVALYNSLAEAYEMPPPTEEDVARSHESVVAGGIGLLARDLETGEAAGGGNCTVPMDGTTEVAGIGVRPAYQRRGIAAAVTSRLVTEAFEAGVDLAFLMAAGTDEERIYARAGFKTVGETLHISLPAG
jgi:ribosomal protein S18 acetylase RimI-like enzyme